MSPQTLRLLLFLAALTLSALCAGLVDWLGRPLPPLIIASPTVPAP